MTLTQTVRYIAYGLTYADACRLIDALKDIGIESNIHSSSGVSMFLTDEEKALADPICQSVGTTLKAESLAIPSGAKYPQEKIVSYRRRGESYARDPSDLLTFRLVEIYFSDILDAKQAASIFLGGALSVNIAYSVLSGAAWAVVEVLKRDLWLRQTFQSFFTKAVSQVFDLDTLAFWEQTDSEAGLAAWTVINEPNEVTIAFTYKDVTLQLYATANGNPVPESFLENSAFDTVLTLDKDGYRYDVHSHEFRQLVTAKNYGY